MAVALLIVIVCIAVAVLGAAIGSVAGQGVSAVRKVEPEPTTYRSMDGRSYFRFAFAERPTGFRIYILVFPNASRGSCHVLRDARGLYVCWSDRIATLAEAKAVAKAWAEATLVYQRTGRAF